MGGSIKIKLFSVEVCNNAQPCLVVLVSSSSPPKESLVTAEDMNKCVTEALRTQ